MTADTAMLHSDAFAWRMESDPALRSTVVAVARLRSQPDWTLLRIKIDRLTRLDPRLRMRAQTPPTRLARPRWTVDESFDLDFHLRRVRVPSPGGWEQVLEFARTAAMADFDRERPLWEFTLLEDMSDGGGAFVTKLHHSLTDGIGGMALAALVVDPGPETSVSAMQPKAPQGHRLSDSQVLLHAAAEGLNDTARAGRRLPGIVFTTLRHPLRTTRDAVRTELSVGRLVRPIRHADSDLFGERSTRRHLATLQVPMADLFTAAHEAGCHLNDAFLAAVTDGVRRYHATAGHAPPFIHLTVPVSVRTPDDGPGGNRITLVRIHVPSDALTWSARIRGMAAALTQWRHEPALDHTQGVAHGLNLLPAAYLGGVLKRVEVVASDVPGLPRPVWLAGAAVSEYYAFGPTIGAGLNCTLLTYAGTCYVGVNIDTGAVVNPKLMIRCLEEAFADLVSADEMAPTS